MASAGKNACGRHQEEATRNAVRAGANIDTIEVIEREDVPLAYLPGNATRIHVKVVGEMGGVNAH